MPPPGIHPVETVREHATAFEAALSVCLAGAKPKAVHKLRTESRRLEAQIALLTAIRGLPPYRKYSDKVLRQIAKFRRAAGRVRDLDVQTSLIEEHGKHASRQRHSQAKPVNNLRAAEINQQRDEDLRQMIATREHRRAGASADLLALIEERQAKVSKALEKLLSALEPVEKHNLSSSELTRIAEERFSKNPALRRKKPTPEDLHSVRKAAKQTRYIAEIAGSGSAEAKAVAARFEHLQEAGGEWHDWLDLAHDAAKEIGRKHALALEFAELRDRHLAAYQALLERFR